MKTHKNASLNKKKLKIAKKFNIFRCIPRDTDKYIANGTTLNKNSNVSVLIFKRK